MTNEVDTRYTQERELSWLRFDERVLAEARDETVPLFERLKFAAIFTSNLDEFFMIRVGSISDMALSKEHHVDSKSGLTPSQQLQAICKAVPALYKQRDKIVSQLEKRLRACNICSLTVDELDGKERKQVERWFRDYVQPILSPMVVDSHHPFPHLPSNSLTIALTLRLGNNHCFGLVPIPKALPPYFQLEEQGLRYLLTEQIVLHFADQLFETYQVEEKCVISVTRNADISPEDEDYDVGEDFRAHMQKVLKKRARLAPVRLEIQGEASAELQQFLCQRLNLTAEQVLECEDRGRTARDARSRDGDDSALALAPTEHERNRGHQRCGDEKCDETHSFSPLDLRFGRPCARADIRNIVADMPSPFFHNGRDTALRYRAPLGTSRERGCDESDGSHVPPAWRITGADGAPARRRERRHAICGFSPRSPRH